MRIRCVPVLLLHTRGHFSVHSLDVLDIMRLLTWRYFENGDECCGRRRVPKGGSRLGLRRQVKSAWLEAGPYLGLSRRSASPPEFNEMMEIHFLFTSHRKTYIHRVHLQSDRGLHIAMILMPLDLDVAIVVAST